MMSSCRCATRWHCCAVGHEFHTSRNFNNVTEHCWKQGNCFQPERIQVSSKTQNVDRVTRTRPEHAPHTASATRRPFSGRPQGLAGPAPDRRSEAGPEKASRTLCQRRPVPSSAGRTEAEGKREARLHSREAASQQPARPAPQTPLPMTGTMAWGARRNEP